MVILSWWNCIWTDNLLEIYIPFPALQEPGKAVCFSGRKFIRLYFINVKMAGWVINGRKLGHRNLWERMKYDTAIKRTWCCRVCRQASTPKPPPRRGQPSPARREQCWKQMPRRASQASTLPCLDATRDIFNIHKGGGSYFITNDSLPLIHLLSIYCVVRKWKNWFGEGGFCVDFHCICIWNQFSVDSS